MGFLLSYCCVLLTKESGIILPLLIVLVDYFFRNSLPRPLDARRNVYLSLMLISVLYIYLRMNLLGNPELGSCRVRYLSKILWSDYHLRLLFENAFIPCCSDCISPSILPVDSFQNPVFIASLVLVGSLLVVAAVACWNRFRELSFLILWVFVTLFPVSGIISLTLPALEHRLYLASVCFSMVIPLLFYRTLLLAYAGAVFQKQICVQCTYSCRDHDGLFHQNGSEEYRLEG